MKTIEEMEDLAENLFQSIRHFSTYGEVSVSHRRVWENLLILLEAQRQEIEEIKNAIWGEGK